MTTELMGFFSLACRLLLLLVFLRAALHKTFDFLEFSGFVADYRLLPGAWSKAVAGLLITLESTVVLLALPAETGNLGMILAMALLALYGSAIAINLLRGHRRIECGCGGGAQQLSWNLVVRNALLIALASLAMLGEPVAVAMPEGLLVFAAALFLWLIYQFAEVALGNRDAQQALENWREL